MSQRKTLYAYENLLLACANKGLFNQSWKTYNDMKKDGITPSIYTMGHLANVCSTCTTVQPDIVQERINKIIEELDKYQIKPSLTFFNILMKTLIRIGKYQNSMDFIDKIKSVGLRPDIASYSTYITAKSELYKQQNNYSQNHRTLLKTLNLSANSQELDQLKSEGMKLIDDYLLVIKDLKKQQIHLDRYFVNTLLHCCKQTNYPEGVFKVWDQIKEMRFSRDSINADTRTYDIFISTCNYTNNISKAIEFLNEIIYKDIRPDVGLINQLFRITNRIVNSKQTEEYNVNDLVNRIISYQERFKVLPNHESFSILISTFSRLNQMNRVYELFLEMNQLNLIPNIYDYTGLIKGFENDIEKVLNIFRVIVQQNQKLTPEFTQLILSIVRKKGTGDMVDEISQGIRKLES
ncbi:hypothetical protein DLAC_10869 [Tieghemostelium lacteum]|uniref:Pentacotripeptide-repeat region of PRORP domain-containing protein n=1 Tax=Tieghemostelium lacteum TaxID=361077 RepID=A0A151Z2K4_TIELA|nr:hypothetical protein DLAC_10869 [Tieghemostelium lacteum]|eukprot:KYQ88185.1 hypothetical protein DLAC_10869 [Tieghemostelium lacteum]